MGPTRRDVEADVGHAVRRQMAPADIEQRLLHCRRHPGKHAMRDDVIEFAQVAGQRGQVAMLDADVGQAQLADEGGARLRLHPRQLHPHAFGLGPAPRQGNQVAALRAPQFEDARMGRIGRIEAMQSGHRRQKVRLGFGQRQAVVGEFVVTGEGTHGRDCPS